MEAPTSEHVEKRERHGRGKPKREQSAVTGCTPKDADA